MGGDPLDEIMGYLGLGPKPSPLPVEDAPTAPMSDGAHHQPADGESLLATAGSATLWLTGNEGAERIEVRGPFTTLRATRPKAKLLVDVRQDIERWADGQSPEVKARDLSIQSARRYRSWKPVRLTRDQARAILRLIDHVRSFARS